jgi:hypothetical protein
MGVRATCTHKTTESGDTIRVDLISSTYSGSAREVKGTGRSWMRFTHDQLDYSNVFSTQVQRGRLEFSFYVQDATDKGVIDDVLSTAQGEYTMAYYRNGTLQWIGEVMMDQLGAISVAESYPYAVTLVARDFVPLEGQLFPLEDNRQLLSTVLGRLLSATGYDLPIWTHTSWTETNINSSNDFLRQLYVDTRNLRDFSKDGDLQITYLEALERIVAPFKAVLKQANGVFVFDQLSAYETPSSVLRTIYDKDGAFVSQSNVNTTVAANSSVTVVRGSIDEVKPGYKRATVTYAHRTPQGDIPFLPRIVITEATPGDVAQSEFVESGKQLTLTGRAGANYSTAIANAFRPEARIQIQLGSNYWNNALQTWQATPVESTFVMSGNVLSNPLTGEIAQDTFSTDINITTAATPTSGTLTITLKKAVNPPGATSETVYLDMDFIILENDQDKSSTAISYTTEQALSFTQNYNGQSYYFGDGPTIRSASALRYSTTVTHLTTSWTRRGESDNFEFHEIALKEIMDHYRGYGRVGSYTIKLGNYNSINVLTYETRALFYVGGTFDGYTGWWSPIVFQLALVTGFDQLVVGYVAGPSLITSTTLTAVSLATNNSIEANANYVFRLATQVSGTVTSISLEPQNIEYPLLKKDTQIRVVHPVTLEQYTFTLDQDMIAGSLNVAVVSTQVDDPLPRGSYIYTNPGDGAAALIIGRDSIRLIAETTSIGVTTQQSLGPVTSIQVVLNTRVRAGDDLFLVRTLDATKRAFTVGQTAGPGLVTLQLDQSTVFDAPAGSYITGNNAQYEAFLQVTPSGVLAKAEAIGLQNGFAILSAPVGAGTPTNGIPVTSVRTLTLKDAMQIGIQDKAGNTEFFQVDGDQNLTNATTTVAVVNKTPSISVGAGASVFQPQWNQTAILSVQAGEIATRVTETQVQALIDENLGGLLPAENWLFEGTDEGFTTNNVTLTTDTTYIEYLATGSTPYIQKTGLSIDADDNPVVTIRVQRVAGTNWGGAFGWTTDGSTYFTQTFVEPTGVDLDFQFATVDLTSNTDYTGTITGVRLFLGEANLDEFYIDQFIIGKFNPQTEILADLSSRLTVAEAGLTNTANEFTTYTQNAVLTNASAVVAVGRNQTTTYDTVAITDTRGGFTVKDGQDFYLVNVDGTFQAVKIRDDQTVTNVTTPTTYTLKIQSITFSTTIAVGAMLYESAWTQSTRISQSAGQIVLKAIESSPGQGYVDSVALVQLTASVGSGSSVKIKGDLIELNNIQIIRDTGSGLIQTQNFVAGTSGWRIRGTGDAEFNNVTVRGSVFVTGGDAATQTFANTAANTAESNAISASKAALNVTIRANSAPATRPDTTAIRAGDVWINTASGQGNLPHTYDGTTPYNVNGWIRMYTVIDGGNITTGTLRADLVTIQSTASNPNVVLDSTGITLRQIDATNDTEVSRSIHWINATDAGTIANQARLISYASGSNIAIDAAGTGNAKDFRFSVRRNISGTRDFDIGISGNNGAFNNNSLVGDTVIVAQGKILIQGSSATTIVGLVVNNGRVGVGNLGTDASYKFNVTGNSLFTGTITSTGNFSTTGNVTGNDILANGVVGTARVQTVDARFFSAASSFANYAQVEYNGTGNRTYTIPFVAASNFVMSEGNQTINGAKTFGSAITSPSIILGSQTAKATIAYTTNTARTYTIPNVAASDFVMTAGAQTIGGVKAFSSRIDAQSDIRLLDAGAQQLNLSGTGSSVTANRTYTFPDASGEFVITAGSQIITGTKTFAHDRLQVRNTGADGVATLRYGTASANRTYTFSGANGTVWTDGNLPISNAGPGSNTPTTRLIITLNGVQYRFDVQQL